MKIIKTEMKDLFILQGKKFVDKRGWLKETFKESYFNKKMVVSITSKSKKNVLRGLHLQTKKTQDKMITCLKGKKMVQGQLILMSFFTEYPDCYFLDFFLFLVFLLRLGCPKCKRFVIREAIQLLHRE